MIPSNEGRGYVLRRIIRRAIRHGYKLGQTKPFFHRIVGDLSKVMGDAYPELPKAQDRVTQVLRQEEERFAETLENGMKVLEGALTREDKMLDGETVFQLYDTFGFPVDLTADIARERSVRVDYAGFEAAMGRQRERARSGPSSGGRQRRLQGRQDRVQGYDTLAVEDAKVVAIYARARRCRPVRGRFRHRGARPHAVLRRVRRPGRRLGRWWRRAERSW